MNDAAPRAPPGATRVVLALGAAQTIAWGSSYYLPAILAAPMAAAFGIPASWVFGAFSAALLLTAVLGPAVGRAIDTRGGRPVLALSNLVLAAGLVGLGLAQEMVSLTAAWLVLGLGMALGLYDSAFAALAGLYGRAARAPITGITLIAGFASTIAWPMSLFMADAFGWRGACFGWAAVNLLIGLPLNRLLVPPAPPPAPLHEQAEAAAEQKEATPPPRFAMPLLAYVFAAGWFVSSAMAAHLPSVLPAVGLSAAAAVAAGALIGPSQVGARLAEFSLLRRFHPLLSSRFATLGHPLGAAALAIFGAPAAAAFVVLHGMGNGLLTIAKGTLPLAVFGPAGYGARQGLLSAPARVLSALAPAGFGLLLEQAGVGVALAVTSVLTLSACVALLLLRPARR